MREKGLLFIVSAPSGAGKTTLCRKAVNFFPNLHFSLSYTTRRPRKGEREGVDYYFISNKAFQDMYEKGEFLEWAEVHGNRYGTHAMEVESTINSGCDLLFDIDVQGARQIKNNWKDGVFIFILPPTLEACKKRLKKRGGDSEQEISIRVERARQEITNAGWYDYLIVNDTVEEAFERLKSIIIAEKNRTKRVCSLIDSVLTT